MEIKDIRRIIEMMKTNDLTEFEMAEDQFRISIKRGGAVTVGAMPQQVYAPSPEAPAPVAPSAIPAVVESVDEDEGLVDIIAPIVGTVYHAASPDDPPFVSVGDEITEDTVVCIIEAMKVMNEIKADVKGVVKKILIDNASPVEYSQAIFKVEPR